MPKLTIDGQTFDVERGKRLVLAIEESGFMIGHRCGGNARCTTCRVEFLAGEPETMTEAEYARLRDRGLLGLARLSCQITVDHDMNVHPILTTENSPEWGGDNGPAPEPVVKPVAEFHPKEKFKD
jgi:ferredoxin